MLRRLHTRCQVRGGTVAILGVVIGHAVAVSSAQVTFAAMLRDELAPRLRQLGFKGSGQAFSIPDDERWIHIGFQKSAWSDADAVRFTANVTVASKAEWDRMRQERTHLPAKPAPNTFYGSFVWQKRIGHLLPGGEDHWWSIGSDLSEAPRVAALVAAAIHDHVLPAIRAHLEAQA